MKHPTEAWQGQTRREEIIVDLLSRYHDLIAASVGGPGDGTGVIGMPPTYTSSVKALEQALCDLRTDDRYTWWHVTERYIRCTKSQKDVIRFRGRWIGLYPNETICAMPGGWVLQIADERDRKRSQPRERVNATVVRWDPFVKTERVREGVGWLSSWFYVRGLEPFIPQEVFADVA